MESGGEMEKIAGWIKSITKIVLIGLILGLFLMSDWFRNNLSGGDFFYWSIGGLIVLGAAWFRSIPAQHAALKIRFEKPIDKKVYSGVWTFAIWPIERFQTWPKKQIQLNFESQAVISGKKEVGGKIYSQANITLDSAMYFNWPDEFEGLVSAYEHAPDPWDENAVRDHLEEFVTSIIREVAGEVSWMECKQGIVQLITLSGKEETRTIETTTFNDYILRRLLPSEKKEGVLGTNHGGNPILQAGLQNVKIVLTNVKLPPALELAISSPEVAEYNATAAKIEALGKKEVLTSEGEGEAAARKAVYSAIIELGPDATNLEILHTLRAMAQGEASTIFYGLPANIANIIREKTGIEATDEQFAKTVAKIKEALEKNS